jgi:uncharacterized protein with FMN-binding domain
MRFKKMYPLLVSVMMASLAVSSCKSIEYPPTPDLSAVPDGTYSGEAQEFVVLARVNMRMAAGRIDAFEIIKHTCSPFGRPAEALAKSVIERQSLDLDAVSGATISSKAILGAGKNALSQAK